MLSLIFSFSGRLGRLAYLGLSILCNIVWGILIALGLKAGSVGHLDHDLILTTVGLLLAILGVIMLQWSVLSLTVRRLNDLDLSGVHASWVLFGPSLLAIVASKSASGLLFVAALLGLGIGLWLIFAPGTDGRNSFG